MVIVYVHYHLPVSLRVVAWLYNVGNFSVRCDGVAGMGVALVV